MPPDMDITVLGLARRTRLLAEGKCLLCAAAFSAEDRELPRRIVRGVHARCYDAARYFAVCRHVPIDTYLAQLMRDGKLLEPYPRDHRRVPERHRARVRSLQESITRRVRELCLEPELTPSH